MMEKWYFLLFLLCPLMHLLMMRGHNHGGQASDCKKEPLPIKKSERESVDSINS